jgi:protein disulfide-isomerase A6
LIALCGGDEKATILYTDEFKNSKLTKFLNGFYGGEKCAEAIKLDADTDFTKMRVSQLKQLLQAKGVKCENCLEKGDFVKKLLEVVAGGAGAEKTEL